MRLSLLALSFIGWLSFAAASPVEKRATVCNGHAELCSRSYANVTHIGAHDSYAIDTSTLDFSANQNIAITAQLNLGVRLLQAQGHLSNGHVELCHTNCALYDGGSLASYLTTIKTWLDSHPNEVVTLVVTNGDNVAVSTYWAPIFVSTGISQYAYVPPSSVNGKNGWPTLNELITSGKRLVVFMDYNTDLAAAPYILPEFNYIWETPYDATDSSFPCSVDRGTASNLAMINHFLDTSILGILVPNRGAAATTNSVSSIVANANGCTGLNGGVYPTFVLLDWVDKGAAIAAGNTLNRVS